MQQLILMTWEFKSFHKFLPINTNIDYTISWNSRITQVSNVCISDLTWINVFRNWYAIEYIDCHTFTDIINLEIIPFSSKVFDWLMHGMKYCPGWWQLYVIMPSYIKLCLWYFMKYEVKFKRSIYILLVGPKCCFTNI